MASMNRPKIATHVINENVTIDTTDREDHTFCGIAFPVQCKTILPVERVVIQSLSVRGALGPLTVWVTKSDEDSASEGNQRLNTTRDRSNIRYNLRERVNDATVMRGQMIMKERYWEKVYERRHRPSFRDYCELDFGDNPIIVKPGEIRGIYIHSTEESDQALVYDNQQNLKTYDDKFLTVLPGRSHVSPELFGTRPIWGWGNAWRDNREFVGRISYGVVFKLWNPSEHLSFGGNFRGVTRVLFMAQRRWESTFSMLSDDCIFYILNMCRWDWMKDTFDGVRGHKKRLRDLDADNNDDNTERDDDESEEVNDDNDAAVVEANDADTERDDEIENALPNEVEIAAAEESSDDSDHVESDAEESDGDDDGGDDRGGSTFQYTYYDDAGSSGEEREAEALRDRQERRRQMWIRAHFGRQFVRVHSDGNEDSEESE